MPTPNDALDTLAARLREERDQALAQLRRAEQQLQGVMRQSEQLDGFRGETLQRFGAAEGQATSPDQLRHLHHFIGRVDEALLQQQGAIEQARKRCERSRALLVGVELRLASVDKLLARRAQQSAEIQRRREQKQSDEFASRSAWNRLHGEGAAPGLH